METGAEAKNGGEENERRDRNLFKTIYDISKFTVPVKKKLWHAQIETDSQLS